MNTRFIGAPFLFAALVVALALITASGPALAADTYIAPLDVRKSADAKFVSPPKAELLRTRAPAVSISFEISAPTDVQVDVTDAAGRILRHLAAGLLGKNAPEPFQKDSLRQQMIWDGKDDGGRVIVGDPAALRVRVALGLTASDPEPAFGTQVTPNDLTNVVGLVAGSEGKVYVLSERWNRAWWRHTAIHVYKRDGSYEKTIKPFPASLAAERVAGITNFRDEDGRPIPTVYRVNSIDYYPTEDLNQQPAVTPDGNIHMLGLRASYYNDRESSDRHFESIAPDGGLAYKDYVGPEIPGERAPGDIYLVSASDGKALFATGIERGEGTDSTNRPNMPLVYRIELPARDKAATFFGDPAKPGADDSHLNDPRGIASDGKGQLFVADRGNNRVVVLDEKSGKFVWSFAVKSPNWVGYSRKNGSVYVASEGAVITFAPRGSGMVGPWDMAEAARLALPVLAGREATSTRFCFAIDADGPVLWVGRNRGDALAYAVEKDGKFGALKLAACEPARMYWSIAAGYDGRTVACKAGNTTLRILDEDTGKTRDLHLEDSGGQTYRLGPNNQVYGIDHWRWGVRRWDANGKPLPFPETMNDAVAEARGRLKSAPSGTTSWERDFDVDRQGNVYVKHRGPAYHGRMRADKYDKDGKFVGTVVWVLSDGAHGPRVDAAGNVYIADTVKPVGRPYPDFFKDKFPKVKIDKRGSPANQYEWMYGSVVKFPPAGGAIWFPIAAENDNYAFTGKAALPDDQPKIKIESCVGDRMQIKPAELQGALWFHDGIAYILDMHPGHNRRCHCTGTDFDVDDYGRVFYTDQGRFRVVVLDTNGNEIVAFGRYGNQDSLPPDIAFNWFTGLGATDRYVYVADGANHRILRVALKHSAEASCDVK